MTRAGTSLTNVIPAGVTASYPDSAPGAFMRAGEPGAAAMGIMAGARPKTLATKSRATTGASRKVAAGPSASAEARPSVNGH